jgi:hypothetical protein
MQVSEELIPSPPLVRARLTQSLRQTRLLKRLLRLSVEAAEDRHEPKRERQPEATRPGEVA